VSWAAPFTCGEIASKDDIVTPIVKIKRLVSKNLNSIFNQILNILCPIRFRNWENKDMGRHQSLAIHLAEKERTLLEEHCKRGDWTPREVLRAKILLLADQNGPNPLMDEEIAQQLNCSLSTVWNRRRRFSETRNIEDTIFDRARTGRPTIIDGAVEAHMTTIACTEAPEGHSRWTLRLIRDRMVALEIIDEISHTTVGKALKKKNSSRG
jgi:transposase